MIAYVVESPVTRSDGERAGTVRVWVRDEERARALAAEHPDRTYRAVTTDDMPEAARRNMWG